DQRSVLRMCGATQCDVHRQHGREAQNVVSPKGALDLRKVGFAQEIAVAGWLQVYATNLDIDGVFLRSHQQVGAVAAQLAVDLVAYVGRDGDHRSGHGHAESNGDSGKQFAAL